MELIDRNEFAKILYLNVRNDNLRIYAEVCNILKDAPIVDAVEVVRCKDCRFAEEAYCRDGKISRTEIYCVWHDERHENNYYCAGGERKKD